MNGQGRSAASRAIGGGSFRRAETPRRLPLPDNNDGLHLQPGGANYRRGCAKVGSQVNMIRLAEDAIRLAIRVAHDGGAIRVELRSRVQGEERAAFLRAEDDVDDNEAQ